ncbi:MAG: cytochrome c biogenesis protein CcsA [Armatimonadetes bacterium]|nr:cytochrome c biogenesis protein CcsA [Armatimonadota bacterium]
MSPFLLAALVGYPVASVCAHLHVFTGSERARHWAPWALGFAAGAHTLEIGRTALSEHVCPFMAAGPTVSFIAWLLALFQLFLYRRSRWEATGAVLLPITFIALFYASLAPRQNGLSTELMRDPLFSPHVLAAILGFCSLALAFGAAILYLAEQGLLKRKQAIKFSRLPPLTSLGLAAHRLAVVGFSLLTLGLGSGILWATREGWPQWYLEPKALTTTIAWLVYAAYVAQNGLRGWRGRRSCYVLIAGFALVLVAYFGVNLLSPGQHRF